MKCFVNSHSQFSRSHRSQPLLLHPLTVSAVKRVSAGLTSNIAGVNITTAMTGITGFTALNTAEMMSLKKKGLMPMGAGNAHLQEIHPQSHQGVCADAIAALEGIDRRTLDEHAAESQRRAAIARCCL